MQHTKKNIALVMGGYGGEHDVSIASGNQVYSMLNKDKYSVYKIIVEKNSWYWDASSSGPVDARPVDRADFTVMHDGNKVHFDLAFIIIHGNPGENGVLQGYLDMLHIPYTTCGFYTSALTFNKGYCNPVVRSFGIVNVACSVLLYSMPSAEELLSSTEHLRYPLFVKPAAGGSSVATSKVKTPDALAEAVRLAFSEDAQVLVEECISGREFDCGVMQLPSSARRLSSSDLMAFPVTEIIPTHGREFFDYDAKYNGFSREVTPAEVSPEVSALIQNTSLRLYRLLGCRGIVRFDFIYDVSSSELYFLEVNTVPGQSAESIVPKQARAVGISPAELYDMAIEAALEQYA